MPPENHWNDPMTTVVVQVVSHISVLKRTLCWGASTKNWGRLTEYIKSGTLVFSTQFERLLNKKYSMYVALWNFLNIFIGLRIQFEM